MPTYTQRKLEAFSLHARNGDQLVDYDFVFDFLASLQPQQRQRTVGERFTAIPVLRKDGPIVVLHAYSGDVKRNPLIFDAQRIAERTETLAPGEVLVEKTHGCIDVGKRTAIIEYVQRGAKAAQIAHALEVFGRANATLPSLMIEFTPIPDEEFVPSIERFSRITAAGMVLARPNVDWTESYNFASSLAADSEARTIEIAGHAAVRRSLAKDRGIVRLIKDLAREPLSVFRKAWIKGVRRGERGFTTLNLENRIEHQKVSVRKSEQGHVEDGDVEQKMLEYLDSREG